MGKNHLSIKELMDICYPDDVRNKSSEHLLNRLFFRGVSMYITKLFLHIGISANQTTLLSMFIVAVGALLMSVGEIYYMIVGGLVMLFFPILDCVDGQIARYNKSKDIFTGKYLENMSHPIVRAMIFIGLGIGLYNSTGYVISIIYSLLLTIGLLINVSIEYALYPTLSILLNENLKFRDKYFEYNDNKKVDDTIKGDKNVYKSITHSQESFILSRISKLQRIFRSIVEEGTIVSLILLSLVITTFIPEISIFSVKLTPTMLLLLFYTVIYLPILMVKIAVIKKVVKDPHTI